MLMCTVPFSPLWPFIIGLFFLTACSVDTPSSEPVPPNILIIVADDLGWADLGCYGSTFYRTPVLDELASDGIRYTNAYASCPVCSPSRVSLMTGAYPVKTNVTDWIVGRQANGAKPFERLLGPSISNQLPLEEQTIAEYVLQRGYTTFFAGKWHMGNDSIYWPENQGFQVNKGGYWAGAPRGKKSNFEGGYFTPYQNPRLTDGPVGEYLTDRLTDETLQFLKEKDENPFLAYLSFYTVHNPMQAPESAIRETELRKNALSISEDERFQKDEDWMIHQKNWRQRKVQDHPIYAAMVERMDANIGRIIKFLKEEGLYENTLIVFTSDNGGLSTSEGSPTVNGILRAGKGWIYEGGIRVPFILKKATGQREGRTSEEPVIGNDVFATVMDLLEPDKIKQYRDGHSLLQPPMERSLFWHYPHYSNQGGRPAGAVRKGAYKLIHHFEDGSYELFHLKTDPSEKVNIIDQNPTVFQSLKTELQVWSKAQQVLYPSPNPDYVGGEREQQ